MGIPILRPEPEPLPLFKGYFVAHPTANLVGSYPPDVFVSHQRHSATEAFLPLVSIAGGLLSPAWAGRRLFWIYGALGEDGGEWPYFRLHDGGLEYLGTARHPTPDWLAFERGSSEERPVPPGFLDWVAQDAEDGSTDEDGWRDSPAAHVGGEAPLPPDDRPTCLQCRGAMAFVGTCKSDVFSDELVEDLVVHLFYCEECCVQCCMDRPS